MAGLFVNDGQVGASIANAFTGGSLDPAGDARMITGIGNLRLQQQRLELERQQLQQQEAARQVTMAKERAEMAAAAKLRQEQEGLGRVLGETGVQEYGTPSPMGKGMILAPSRQAITSPTSITDQVVAGSGLDAQAQAKLALRDELMRRQAQVISSSGKSAEDVVKSQAGVQGNWAVQYVDPEQDPNALRRGLALRGDANAYNKDLAFTEQQRVRLAEEEAARKLAEIDATKAAELRYGGVKTGKDDRLFSTPQMQKAVPGLPAKIEPGPDVKDVDQFRAHVESQKAYTNYTEAKTYYKQIMDNVGDATQPGTPIDDHSLIVAYTKLQDPGTAALGGEVSATEQKQAWDQRFMGNWQYFTQGTGKLTPESRRQLATAAERAMGSHVATLSDVIKGREQEAATRQYRPEAWIPEGFRAGQQHRPTAVKDEVDVLNNVPIGGYYKTPDGRVKQRMQ